MSRPSNEDYRVIFEDMPGGAQILEELVAKFGSNPYVKGGHEGDRQTAYNAGQLNVISYILNRINNASQVNDND